MSGPIDMVSGYLDENGVQYEVVEHEERFTAASEARAAGVEPQDAAKEVLLRSEGGYALAVIPASERLDLQKVRRALDTDSARCSFGGGSCTTGRPGPKRTGAGFGA